MNVYRALVPVIFLVGCVAALQVDEADIDGPSDVRAAELAGSDASPAHPVQPPHPPCPADGRVAFSVVGASHVSAGPPTLLSYTSATVTEVGGGWPRMNNGSTFTAPCNGLYVFTVSFVKDAYYHDGTTDDVYVDVNKNGSSLGHAWSGQGGGQRSTGTYTASVILRAGDTVNTTVSGDGDVQRHLMEYNFTGFLVK